MNSFRRASPDSRRFIHPAGHRRGTLHCRLCEVGARILLSGVGIARCTVFHLAECRYLYRHFPTRLYRCVVTDNDGQKGKNSPTSSSMTATSPSSARLPDHGICAHLDVRQSISPSCG
ncbi:AAC(3) family N-acetyltransferase [Herbidospora daliensis]|uniref:AAC(3) family N-acetyltransferase n=1 Tax=Herbidospora daliensis TaxID=295585 RepID=UPI0012F75FC9